uniref:Uncharacterized protein n=1 Tax=Xiphophorus maculatus TaxID=8083 RepID=A0A3B5QQL5_XIPMA
SLRAAAARPLLGPQRGRSPKLSDRSPAPAPEAEPLPRSWVCPLARSTTEASTTATAEPASAAAASSSSFCCLAWVFLWFLRLEKVLKALLHSGHTCGRSPVCVLRCSVRCMLWMKPFPQVSQRNGRSPVWTRMCSRRCRYGRTPEWMRVWRIRLASREKVLPQSEHWKGFSPVCMRMWFCAWICFLKNFPHTPHTNLR